MAPKSPPKELKPLNAPDAHSRDPIPPSYQMALDEFEAHWQTATGDAWGDGAPLRDYVLANWAEVEILDVLGPMARKLGDIRAPFAYFKTALERIATGDTFKARAQTKARAEKSVGRNDFDKRRTESAEQPSLFDAKPDGPENAKNEDMGLDAGSWPEFLERATLKQRWALEDEAARLGLVDWGAVAEASLEAQLEIMDEAARRAWETLKAEAEN